MAYTISKHAEERYAQRIMEKDNKTDIVMFISDHKEKIIKDINNMIEYGKVIYTGKHLMQSINPTQKSSNQNSICNYILNGTWVVIVAKDTNNVITLYDISLHVDKELDELYILKMISRIEAAEKTYMETIDNVKDDNDEFRSIIEGNDDRIAEFKKNIKSLEEINDTYRKLILQNNTNVDIAEQNLREEVLKLIGKRGY